MMNATETRWHNPKWQNSITTENPLWGSQSTRKSFGFLTIGFDFCWYCCGWRRSSIRCSFCIPRQTATDEILFCVAFSHFYAGCERKIAQIALEAIQVECFPIKFRQQQQQQRMECRNSGSHIFNLLSIRLPRLTAPNTIYRNASHFL